MKYTEPKDPKAKGENKKAMIGEVPGINEIKERFKGKYTVNAIKHGWVFFM